MTERDPQPEITAPTPEHEPTPAAPVRGPVRILEKAIPARRPIVPMLIKRMNG
jgi:hypothetical protein